MGKNEKARGPGEIRQRLGYQDKGEKRKWKFYGTKELLFYMNNKVLLILIATFQVIVKHSWMTFLM